MGFKFQFLGKISNISTSGPSSLGQFSHCAMPIVHRVGPT